MGFVPGVLLVFASRFGTKALTSFCFSERKYKEKLKIWKFDKYLSGAEMKFIVSKDESRELEGKATAFYSHGIEINSRRIHSFKKRAKQQADAIETSRSPSAGK